MHVDARRAKIGKTSSGVTPTRNPGEKNQHNTRARIGRAANTFSFFRSDAASRQRATQQPGMSEDTLHGDSWKGDFPTLHRDAEQHFWQPVQQVLRHAWPTVGVSCAQHRKPPAAARPPPADRARGEISLTALPSSVWTAELGLIFGPAANEEVSPQRLKCSLPEPQEGSQNHEGINFLKGIEAAAQAALDQAASARDVKSRGAVKPATPHLTVLSPPLDASALQANALAPSPPGASTGRTEDVQQSCSDDVPLTVTSPPELVAVRELCLVDTDGAHTRILERQRRWSHEETVSPEATRFDVQSDTDRVAAESLTPNTDDNATGLEHADTCSGGEASPPTLAEPEDSELEARRAHVSRGIQLRARAQSSRRDFSPRPPHVATPVEVSSPEKERQSKWPAGSSHKPIVRTMSMPMKKLGGLVRKASFPYASPRRCNGEAMPLDHLTMLPVRDPEQVWLSLSGYLDPSITNQQRTRIKQALVNLAQEGAHSPHSPVEKPRNVQMQWLQREMWPESFSKTEDLCFGV